MSEAPPQKRALWRYLRISLAVLGGVGVAFLVHRIGPARLRDAARVLAWWVPIAFLVEGLRIVVDALTTRQLYGERGADVPWRELLRVHLIAYPANLLLPAGRAAAEGVKAIALSRFVPNERVAAAAFVAPALGLLGVFVVSLPCVAVAYVRWGGGALTWAIAVQALTALGAALGLLFLVRRVVLRRAVTMLSASLGAATERMQAELANMRISRALAPAFANRALLGVEVALLALAAGAVGSALPAAVGVHLVGAAVGDAVPAQLGATDGSFAYAADALGLSMAHAVAASLSFHAVQLSWALIGALTALVGRSRPSAQEKLQ